MKPLIALLLAGAVVWGCTMAVHNARADDATGPLWEIQAWVVANNDPEQKVAVGKYAGDEKNITKFPTEAACLEFVKTDKALKARIDSGNDKAAKWKPPGHIVLVCTPDNSV